MALASTREDWYAIWQITPLIILCEAALSYFSYCPQIFALRNKKVAREQVVVSMRAAARIQFRLVVSKRLKNLVCPTILPIAGRRIIGFIPFTRVLMLCEMQSVSARIWTRVTGFISYDDNHYTMSYQYINNIFIIIIIMLLLSSFSQ